MIMWLCCYRNSEKTILGLQLSSLAALINDFEKCLAFRTLELLWPYIYIWLGWVYRIKSKILQ